MGIVYEAMDEILQKFSEHAGDATPYGIQHLLDRAKWDADAVRDDLQAYVRTHLADPAGVDSR